MTRQHLDQVRTRTVPLMQLVFGLGTALVTVIGLDLFVLSDQTDRAFAWTVRQPATAGFLGAFYLTASVLAGLSFRRRRWIEVRVGVIGVGLFVVLTLLLTVMHFDRIQTGSTHLLARVVAYAWVAVYALDPPLIAAGWFAQMHAHGFEPRRSQFPAWFRSLLGVQGAVLLGAGALFFLAPSIADRAWPWALDPIDARAIAAWLVGLGFVVGQASWENAWERTAIALDSAAVLGFLELVVLARFHTELRGTLVPAIYASDAVVLLCVGAFGHLASRRTATQLAAEPADVAFREKGAIVRTIREI